MTQKPHKGRAVNRCAIKILGEFGICLLVAGFMLSVFVYAYNSDRFTLRKVTFYGTKELDIRNLEFIVRHDFPANILHINLRQLQIRLEHETWAKRVEIRRVLPSELLIYIQERSPSVILEMNGKLMIADDDGVLLDSYDSRYGKLDVPVFTGVLGKNAESYRMNQAENAARISQGLRMLSEVEAGLPQYTLNISEVDISDKNNLKIVLVDDTAEVLLGDRDFLKRFQTLMSNKDQYRELKAQYSDFKSVDLRFDGQIIYRPRNTTAGLSGGIDKDYGVLR